MLRLLSIAAEAAVAQPVSILKHGIWIMKIFLILRRNTGDERRRTHDINTASWIPDLFMKRVLNDEPWTFFSPEEAPDLHHLYGKAFDEKLCAL